VFSVSKGITATLIHLLVARGKLAYDQPIAEIWPEFGRRGKDRITVAHALAHRSGLPFMPAGLGYADLSDWDRMCGAVADLKPAAPAGSDPVYHAVTFSWILGETARRADGRTFGQLLEEEIKAPLNIAGLYIGAPDAVLPRIAALEEILPPDTVLPPLDDPSPMSVTPWMQPLSVVMKRADMQKACLPGLSGVASARDLARVYAALLPGGVDGVELLSPEGIRAATVLTGKLPPSVVRGEPQRMSLGYFLGGEGCTEALGPRNDAFGHGGYGGSYGFADPQYGLAVGLTKNFISPRGAQREILQAVRRILGIPN
jgi:CubicO group peptidase (beta-lactamase class C family)